LISFPLGTEMFQFPRFRLNVLSNIHDTHKAYRVPPFRYPWFNVCCQLPRAFRRLPRLSSPLTAKASTECASLLDPITLFVGLTLVSLSALIQYTLYFLSPTSYAVSITQSQHTTPENTALLCLSTHQTFIIFLLLKNNFHNPRRF
jgi:hypothetical protein